MSIIFTCSCGKQYCVNDNYAGKHVRCNQCETIIKVPMQSEQIMTLQPSDNDATQRPVESSPAQFAEQSDDAASPSRQGQTLSERRKQAQIKLHEYHERLNEGEFSGPIETSGKAIAAFICGIGGLTVCFLSSIAAVILGHMALSDINSSNGRIGGKWMAIAGLVMGYISISILVIAILIAIIMPTVFNAR